MSTMCYEFNDFIKKQLENNHLTVRNRCYSFSIHYSYDDFTNKAIFYAIRNIYDEELNFLDWTDADFDFYILEQNNDFDTCFNLTDDILNYAYYAHASDLNIVEPAYNYDTPVYNFDNVWNRRYCFIHASFVSGTSFNYLGRSGDFYPKPSKMYRAIGSTTDFTLSISYNGYTPIRTNEISFIVELAYIYSTGEYMAE